VEGSFVRIALIHQLVCAYNVHAAEGLRSKAQGLINSRCNGVLILNRKPYIKLVHHVHLVHMSESKETKMKFGISINKELVKKIDAIVEQSDYLKISRSELIETILEKFMFEHIDKKELAINAVGLVIRSRKGELLV